jgi:hypothetical protein
LFSLVRVSPIECDFAPLLPPCRTFCARQLRYDSTVHAPRFTRTHIPTFANANSYVHSLQGLPICFKCVSALCPQCCSQQLFLRAPLVIWYRPAVAPADLGFQWPPLFTRLEPLLRPCSSISISFSLYSCSCPCILTVFLVIIVFEALQLQQG